MSKNLFPERKSSMLELCKMRFYQPKTCWSQRWQRLAAGLIMLISHGVARAESTDEHFKKEIQPLLVKYCYDCHGDGEKKGDLALDEFQTIDDIKKHKKEWNSIHFSFENWLMPPPKKDQPTPLERQKIAQWIEKTLYPIDPQNPDPGRVTLRRLNRQEYNNTIRDLIGVDIQPANNFPEDDTGYGFDTIGAVLSVPPALIERYLSAAEKVLDFAIFSNEGKPHVELVPCDRLRSDKAGTNLGHQFLMFAEGQAYFSHHFKVSGHYKIQARVHAQQAGSEKARMRVIFSGASLGEFDVTGTKAEPQIIEVTAVINKPEWQRIGIDFINDYWDGKNDRNLSIDLVEIVGPINPGDGTISETQQQLLACAPDAYGKTEGSREILERFATRAFRRPVESHQIDRLVKIVEAAQSQGQSYEHSIKIAMQAVLVSPKFLYRAEAQPEPNDPFTVAPLDEYALASRLSYFLWSSMPDQTLIDLARENKLRTQWADQVKRMIADPKAQEFVNNFAGQWLELRNLENFWPDKRFQFSWELKQAMLKETEMFFAYILRENRSVIDFLNADYTFVNQRLAKYYGIKDVHGQDHEFQKVSLADLPRRGVITHGSVLTITSEPTRTSPVKRGKWVLENLLGTPPPPPPPNVPTLDDSGKEITGTLRQRLEEHRNNSACASCHALLDPIGFGLENFNAVGKWREKYNDEQPIDSSGRLTTGQEFRSAMELTEILVRDRQEAFIRCLISKLLTYSLGRGTEPSDKLFINEIIEKSQKSENRFQDLILHITQSFPFQHRRGDGFRE